MSHRPTDATSAVAPDGAAAADTGSVVRGEASLSTSVFAAAGPRPEPSSPQAATAGLAASGPADATPSAPRISGPPELVKRLDRLLPQTQCGQCGYAGCRPYAEAMAHGEAGVDHCPPGGDAGARRLARLLGVAPVPYDRSRGTQKPPQVALIVEADCIGCTKCIQACPVDAIIGGSKHMHTVIDPLCTGCELCVPACPVDCIVLVAA